MAFVKFMKDSGSPIAILASEVVSVGIMTHIEERDKHPQVVVVTLRNGKSFYVSEPYDEVMLRIREAVFHDAETP